MTAASLPTFVARRQYVIWLALLTAGLSLGWFFLDGHIKVNLADEGFLWYGSEAVRLGQIPMRDFEAYDPGRYYWVAGWSYLFGQGIVSLRLACVIFQCLGVFAGLLVARRLSRNWLFLVGMALLFCLWMHPRYKLFEQSIALMSIYAGVLLLERPSLRRHFAVGLFGGLAAFMGRNHGAYHVVAFFLLVSWAARGAGWRDWSKRLALWVAGQLLGYLPQWLMFLFVSGYFRAYLPYLQAVASGTNLAKPVPWPWLLLADLDPLVRASKLAEGAMYMVLPAFLVLGLLRIAHLSIKRAPGAPLLVASFAVTLPYTHFVFSRPDTVHLAHGAPTALLGVMALLFSFRTVSRRLAYSVLPVLLTTSALAILLQTNLFYEWASAPDSLFVVSVKGEKMLAGTYQAKVISSAQTLAHEIAKPDEPILFVPHMPWLYPFTGRLSPTKQIYFVFPATPETDRALVAEIEEAGVEWVVLRDKALDDQENLRFRRTNPAVVELLGREFEPAPLPMLPGDMILLRRKSRPARR